MKKFLFLFVCLACSVSAFSQIPFLKKNAYNATQLIVQGKPFLMLAGEVNNSSGSNAEYMRSTMKSLRENNLNSVLISVSWEIIEPKEGIFDFSSVDSLIMIARRNNLKLGFLWFGSWKNGLSPYAPVWVMNDTKRFPRVKSDKGLNTRILTPLSKNNMAADARAYAALMKHIALVDSENSTVLVMQVENETGVLGQTRDFSPEANQLFASQVPEALINYMVKNKASLEIELKSAWEKNGSKTKGTWVEVFGAGEDADLFFMAWNYSLYVNAVAEAGKKMYNIPMYANCWMPNPRPTPGKPGNFPSGGPILSVLDIWKAGAPAIDMLAPDLYGGDFNDEAKFFHRSDNPLFIPETNTKEGPGTFAFAMEDAICFSPFGIDNKGSIMTREYLMLSKMIPVIAQYQGSGKIIAFSKSGTETGKEFQLGKDVTIKVSYSRGFGFRPQMAAGTGAGVAPGTGAGAPAGTPATGATAGMPAMNQQNQQQEQPTYGIFIQTGENEFILAGNNLSVTASSTNPDKEVWLKDACDGLFDANGVWIPKTWNNGDEAGFLRSGDPVYGVRGYRTQDAGVFRFRVAVYDKQ